MRVTVRQRIDLLRRAYPRIDAGNARYLYAKASDLRRSGRTVAVWVLMWASDGRTSVHMTRFSNKQALSVPAWAVALDDRAPDVFRDFVVPAINEQSGASWAVDRVIGWHFLKPPTKREKARKATLPKRRERRAR